MTQKELNEAPVNWDKTYLLRGFPESTWRKFKAKLALEGIGAREWFIKKIREYVEEK
jgi:hypothetical protein